MPVDLSGPLMAAFKKKAKREGLSEKRDYRFQRSWWKRPRWQCMRSAVHKTVMHKTMRRVILESVSPDQASQRRLEKVAERPEGGSD